MSDLFTVIIPTYNRAKLLARALMSVAGQDYRPIEVIVIDDGSTDETPRTIPAQRELLASRGIALTYLCQNNAGPAAARNTGLAMAKGSFIACLDSDDLWKPGFLSTMGALFEAHPSAALAFCAIEGIDDDDKPFIVRDTGLPPVPETGLMHAPFATILRYMPSQTSGIAVRKSTIDELGVFDLEVPVVEDWDLWYRISKKHDFAYTVKPLACNRTHPDNLPKYDIRALTSGLKMNLKHLPDCVDESTRAFMLERIHHQMTLLQEQFLREGKCPNGHIALLRHEAAPRTKRYALGGWMLRRPRWMGKTYAAVVRLAGRVHPSKVTI
jgi:glycosyltransferase involved in cell wall biosynthesis